MNILITGANGYIGSKLIPLLLQSNHKLFLFIRDPSKLDIPENIKNKLHIVKGDLLNIETLKSIPEEIDVAFYLVHSMSQAKKDFQALDEKAAYNFIHQIDKTHCKQVIYLSGIQDKKPVSKHLKSRLEVENILRKAKPSLTVLRAGIIIGSGSASFKIMQDLVRKLPIMIAPRWIQSLCQPIAIRDVLYYLNGVIDNESCYGKTFDIGGPDILTYKEMLLTLARVKGVKRWIIQVPVLTPRLSSYWLLLVTSTNFSLAKSLVESLKNDVICKDHEIQKLLPRKCLSYTEALCQALDKTS